MFIIIVFWLGCDRPSGLLFFVPALLLSILTPLLILAFFVCFFILFHSCCSHAQVFGKTLVHEFSISYSHSEWYLLFPTVQLQVHIRVLIDRRGRVDELLFFEYWSPFCFLIIEFHCTFFISYKISFCSLLLYFGKDAIGRRDFFCSCPLCFFPYSRFSSYHFRLFLCLISFLLFQCASVPHFLSPYWMVPSFYRWAK